MGPALAQLVEHLTVVVSKFWLNLKKVVVVIKMSLVRIRQAGKIF
jgi:hypothetical protein